MTTEGSTGYSLGGPTTQGPTGYPIGYWLKRLDRAIDGALEPTLAAEDLTRRHWQTMNFLHQGAERRGCAGRGAAPFWGQGAITLDEVLSELERRALVVSDGGATRSRPQGRPSGPRSPSMLTSPGAGSSTASPGRSTSRPWRCCSA
jgi:hypothetical protein